jgi:acetaldehyde dehydrogenase/alcohol dehydrogenase
MAFTNGRLGLVHGLAHMIGGEFHIPHGRANAFMLCPVFAFWYASHSTRLASLADALGVEGSNEGAKTNNLLTYLDNLKQKVGIPLSIKDGDMDEDRFFSQVDALTASFMNQIAIVPAKVRTRADLPVEAAEVETLYRQAWEGKRPILD